MAWVRNTAEGTLTEGPMIVGLTMSFLSIALLLVCLRLYVRISLIKAMGYGKLPRPVLQALHMLTCHARRLGYHCRLGMLDQGPKLIVTNADP